MGKKQNVFIIAAYIGSGKAASVDVPAGAHCNKAETGEPCVIRRHSKRCRTFGPDHPLDVCFCKTHRVYFTVYPLGFHPYGRRSCLPDDPGGLWRAALDAASGVLWPDVAIHEQLTRNTQMRDLGTLADLLGRTALDKQDEIALSLGLELNFLREITKKIRDGPKTRLALGIQLSEVFKQLPSATKKVVACGVVAGLWPPFLCWN